MKHWFYPAPETLGDRAGAPALEAPQAPWWGVALRRVLAPAFWTVGRGRFDVHVRGLSHFKNRPGTVVVLNHKSDFDWILLLPTLAFAHRLEGPMRHCAFAAGEAMFHPGYLADYVLRDFGWPRRWLHSVSLGPVLRALRAYPIPAARRRSLRAHLLAVLEQHGNLALADIFNDAPTRWFPDAAPDAHLRDVMRWRYHRRLDAEVDFSIFQPMLATALRRQHMTRIQDCLDTFGRVLADGDCLFIAPAGGLSATSCLGEIKAGMARLTRRIDREITLVPVNLTYDAMTSGRTAAFLTFGREMRGVQSWSKAQLDTTVRQAIVSMNTVTLQQLVGEALEEEARQGRAQVGEAALRQRVLDRSDELARRQLFVDPRLLDRAKFDRRWRKFLTYCRRRQLLRLSQGNLAREPRPSQANAPASPDLWRHGVNDLRAALAVSES